MINNEFEETMDLESLNNWYVVYQIHLVEVSWNISYIVNAIQESKNSMKSDDTMKQIPVYQKLIMKV